MALQNDSTSIAACRPRSGFSQLKLPGDSCFRWVFLLRVPDLPGIGRRVRARSLVFLFEDLSMAAHSSCDLPKTNIQARTRETRANVFGARHERQGQKRTLKLPRHGPSRFRSYSKRLSHARTAGTLAIESGGGAPCWYDESHNKIAVSPRDRSRALARDRALRAVRGRSLYDRGDRAPARPVAPDHSHLLQASSSLPGRECDGSIVLFRSG